MEWRFFCRSVMLIEPFIRPMQNYSYQKNFSFGSQKIAGLTIDDFLRDWPKFKVIKIALKSYIAWSGRFVWAWIRFNSAIFLSEKPRKLIGLNISSPYQLMRKNSLISAKLKWNEDFSAEMWCLKSPSLGLCKITRVRKTLVSALKISTIFLEIDPNFKWLNSH